MANTCAYRLGGNNDAARAAYTEFMESMDEGSGLTWDDLDPVTQEQWRGIFRAGHRAYRQFIIDNG